MINSKPDIYEALSGDAVLANLVQSRIYADKCPAGGQYPIVVYTEISNVPAMYADDAETDSLITIQISVLVNSGSTTEIAKQVNKIMIGIGYIRQFSGDLMDGEIKIKSMRFVIAQEE